MEHNLAKVGVAGSIPVSRSEQKERISNRISSFLFKLEPGEVHAKRFAEPLVGTTCAFLRAGPDESKRTHGSLLTSVFDLRADDSATARHEYFAQQNMSPLALVFLPQSYVLRYISLLRSLFFLHLFPNATYIATSLFYVAFSSCICSQMLRISPLSAFTLLFPFSTFLIQRIDTETHDKLKDLAEYEGRSINGEVLYLIRQAIKEHEKDVEKK